MTKLDDAIAGEQTLEHEPQPIPNAGTLGQTPEAHERDRVAALPAASMREVAFPGHGPRTIPTSLEIKLAVVPVVREAMAGIRMILDEQAATLKLLDVPLEHVADAHERASASFENLRKEINDVSQRLAGVEGVIDTAGLMKAHADSAKLLQEIATDVRAQLKLGRETLFAVVQQLSKLEGGALQKAHAQLDRREKLVKAAERRARTKRK